MVNTIHLMVPARFHTAQLNLHTRYRVSDKCGFSYHYFVTREDDKANFSILGATVSPLRSPCSQISEKVNTLKS
jgi:hypothetical protein